MITKELLQQIFPSTPSAKRNRFIDDLNELLPKYSIDSYRRVCAFLATVGVESDYLRAVSEYASGSDYENRRDLGNFVTGDGKRFKGRGLIQTTGRFNVWRVVCRFVKKLTGKDFSSDLDKYRNFAEYLKSKDYDKLLKEADRLDVNFLAHPQLLETPRVAVEAACIFWQENNLNEYADAKKIKQLNAIVNRGDKDKMPLHWEKRNALYSLCIRRVPQNFSFEAEEENNDSDYKPMPIASRAAVSADAPVPVVTAANTDDSAPGLAFDTTKLEASYNTASATLQKPALKRVLMRLGYKILGGLGFVWGSTSGKIALILSLAVIVVAIGGVLYSYRNQIRLGVQVIKASVIKTLSKQTS